MTPERIYADFLELLALSEEERSKPKTWYMPKSQAALLGFDVSGAPDGSVVAIRDGVVGALDDEPDGSVVAIRDGEVSIFEDEPDL